MFRTKLSGGKSSPIGSPGGTVMNRNIGNRKVDKIKIGTWNVRSMYESGKMHNVIHEMQRLKLNILGISETRWPGHGRVPTERGMLYFSGSEEKNHKHGVAIAVSKDTMASVTNFVPISDRVMLLQLQTNSRKLNIIQIYAPTADKPDEEIEMFYELIKQTLESLNSRDINIVLGDFNAKVGKGRCDKYIGEYGIGTRNERGDRLVQFCQEEGMIITNTFYKLPKRRLYTWKSPQDSDQNPVRNQIDYVLINARYRNCIQSVKAYPGADVSSDHNPLIARIHIKLKRTPKKREDRINVEHLKKQEIRKELQVKIRENLNTLHNKEEYRSCRNVNEKWGDIKTALLQPSIDILKKEKTIGKKEWITDEILKLMDKRRSFKGKSDQQYKEIQRILRTKIRKAKEDHYKRKCEEIEELQAKHDNFNIHKKVKEMAGTSRQKRLNILYDNNGKIITEVEQKLDMWKNYIMQLFKDGRRKTNLESIEGEMGPDIIKEEVIYALNTLKNRKVPGPDQLPAEILKLIEEDQIRPMVELINTIYKTGVIPNEWLLSTFITIPKKKSAKHCSDYRTISLMAHTLKILLKVIHNRIYRKLDADVGDTQFGFRKGLGTREALFALNVLSQRCMDVNQDLYACFIDYNKAFDKVRHDQLIETLLKRRIDLRDIRIISNLYYGQKAIVRVDDRTSEEIEIQRGVRQGCILSPTLFNLYSEDIVRKALDDQDIGIEINGKVINNLRYADDTVLLAGTLEDLQAIINKIVVISEEYGLSLNISKTKYMLIAKTTQDNRRIYVKNQPIERVKEYKYLGTTINENNSTSEEIRIRVEQARNTFIKMKRIFNCRDLNLEVKIRLVRCYVLSVLYYGMEAWTLKRIDLKRLEAFELWIYRRILRISWIDKVTNEEVLRRMQKDKEVILTIKRRKMLYMGHIMRGEKYRILQVIMQGKIKGKRSIGRRRNSWLRNLREWFGCTNNQLFRSAISKVKIALMIANLRNGDGT